MVAPCAAPRTLLARELLGQCWASVGDACVERNSPTADTRHERTACGEPRSGREAVGDTKRGTGSREAHGSERRADCPRNGKSGDVQGSGDGDRRDLFALRGGYRAQVDDTAALRAVRG